MLSSGGEVVVRQVMVFPSSDSVDGEVVLGTMLIDAMLWLKDLWEGSVPPPPSHCGPSSSPYHSQSNDTSVEAYEGDPEDDEEYEEEEQVSGGGGEVWQQQ